MTDYTDDDYIFDTHWRAFKRAIAGNAIISGLALTPGTGIQVLLSDGSYYANAVKRSITGGGGSTTINLGAPDLSYDRWDIIVSKTTAPYYEVKQGTAAIVPKPEDLPTGEILIAAVYVIANATQITASDCKDYGFFNHYLDHIHDGGLTKQIPFSSLSPNLHKTQHSTGQPDALAPSDIGAEPAFSKNTAFNKNFGAAAGNVPAISATEGLVANRPVITDPSDGKLRTVTPGTAFNVNFETTPAVLIRPGIGAIGIATTIVRADHVHPLPFRYFPSDALKASNLTMRYTNSTSFVQLKQNTLTAGYYTGIRVSFRLYSSGSGTPVYGQIYVNGSPRGTIRVNTDASPLTFVEDIYDLVAGDVVAIYGRSQTGAPQCRVDNYYMYFSDFHEDTVVTTGV